LIVKRSIAKAGQPTWFDGLSLNDQEYIRDVAYAMKQEPNCHPHTVASLLVDELQLGVKAPAVVKKLKELTKSV
jgi:hypothetical protein